jgi:hypothetical protein
MTAMRCLTHQSSLARREIEIVAAAETFQDRLDVGCKLESLE